MIQNQIHNGAHNNTSRWLRRAGLLIASAVFLVLLVSLLSQQLAAIPVKVETEQASTGKVSAALTATPMDEPTAAAPALLTNTLVATPTLAPIGSTTGVTTQPTVTSSATLTANASTSNSATSALTTSITSEPIALVGSDGATLDGDVADQELPLGTLLTVNGRSADSAWLYVTTSDNETGWVESQQVMAFNLPALPVLEKGETLASTTTDTESVTNTAGAEEPTATALTSDTVATTDTGATDSASPAVAAASDDQPTALVTLQRSRLNVRAGPGTQYPILGKALYNQTYPVLARNNASTWVQLELQNAQNSFGWVSVEFVKLSEPVANLPVSDQVNDTPLPTPLPQPTPVAAADTSTAAATAAPTVVAANSQPAAQQAAPSGQPTGLRGKLVIQTQLGGTFYLYDLATGAARALTSGMDPAISPDGRQIAFARGGSANGIYLINSDGSNERKIFGERDGLRSPKWSPDGQWIVFSRADGSYNCVDLGNAGLCPSASELTADVPDGQKEAAKAQLDQVSKPNYMIARISATGGDYRDLPALNSALAPDWGNGGIVYQSSDGIQRTDDQPNTQTQRIYADYNIQDPDWQPGGSGRIVFQMKQGPHWEIFAVNPNGQGVTALTRPATTLVKQLPSNVAPAWSPDGQSIVFLSNREQNGEAGQWRVWAMNADGSNQRPLSIDLPLTYTFAFEQMVDWGA